MNEHENEVELGPDERLTSESWRSKFNVLIREGRKNRVSPWFLKVIFCLLAAAAIALQLMSGFKPEVRTKVEQVFSIPRASENEATVSVPPFDPRPAPEPNSHRQRSSLENSRPPKIQHIRLTGFEGIPTGTEVPATLSSGGTNGTVIAKLSKNLTADGEVLLPRGTTLYGRGSSSDDRLYVRFKRAILPDKSEQKIKAQAFDAKDRMVGLKGKKISDVAFKIAASSGLIFLAGMAEGLREEQVSIYGTPRKPTVRDAALNGVTTATLEQGKELMNSMKNEEARVEVKFSTEILVIFGDDGESVN